MSMSNFLVKCSRCDALQDFKIQSRFDKVDQTKFLCRDCKKAKSLKDREHVCPKCRETILLQSTTAKKKADQLNSVCKNCRSNQIPRTITQNQKEFLDGLMLGDGGIIWSKTAAYPRLSVMRQLQDKDYLLWQYDLFKDFYGTPPKYFKSYHNKVDKYYEGFSCRTKSGKIFSDYYNKWYPNGKKIVPRDLVLTPLTLLIWFLDDGSVIKPSEHGLQIKFSTDGFPEEDTRFLAQLLSSFINDEVKVYKNGNGFILRLATIAATKLIEIIDPIFPPCMERKRIWKDFDWDYFNNNMHQFGDGIGSIPGNAKLNYEIASQIRQYRLDKNIPTKELAEIFNVSVSTINSIIANKSYKENE